MSSELLTPDEREALRLTGRLASLLRQICGNDSPADQDELVHHLHVIQRYVGSQAAARGYPGEFRLLGRHLGRPIDDVEPGERFRGAQHFGGDAEPAELADCSVPLPSTLIVGWLTCPSCLATVQVRQEDVRPDRRVLCPKCHVTFAVTLTAV